MQASKSLLTCLFLLFLFSCVQTVQSADDLQKFVTEKNGLVKEKKLGAVSIRLSHRPTDLLVNQELGKNPPKKEKIRELREKYGKYRYFILSLSANGKEIESYQLNGTDFGTRIQALAFGMEDKVLMTSGKDTLGIADYQYQRTFGVGNSTDFLFAFEKGQQDGHLKITLQDIGLGIGVNRFQFDIDDLNNVPQIQFEIPKN